ncbi:hypothetical protein [Arachnia propionica]|uniref:Uncharacterized protein n=1 Tax=Arachnia propionica TaxID=1750 RepID=A0A3P1WUH7_9ACTN|nr:hypothetical protein [Arachnia propionica]RRD49060.1 hypothetical protein EII35_09740 [Arachnia propionica]
MQALKADPMASVSWEGLELLGTNQTVNEGHKPEPPIFTRCYKLLVPVSQAFDVVTASALEQGWEEKKRRTAQDATLKKMISGYSAGVILTTHTGGCEEFPETVFRITMLYP